MKKQIPLFLIIGLVWLFTMQMIVLSGKIHPVGYPATVDQEIVSLGDAALKAGMERPSQKIIKATQIAGEQTGLSKPFLLCLMWSESSFKPNAVSSRNYRGLMQVPSYAYCNIFQEDINVLIGARIFMEKLKITKGDYRKALVLYKGWSLGDPKGLAQADKVIDLTLRMKKHLKEDV
jgi:soluble lytic murein transglycosylase-like protein